MALRSSRGAPQETQECSLCKKSYQKRHFRLLKADRKEREYICRGCSTKLKEIRRLVDKGTEEQQCAPGPGGVEWLSCMHDPAFKQPFKQAQAFVSAAACSPIYCVCDSRRFCRSRAVPSADV